MNPQQKSIANGYMTMFRHMALDVKQYTNYDMLPDLEKIQEKIDNLPKGFYAGENGTEKKEAKRPRKSHLQT